MLKTSQNPLKYVIFLVDWMLTGLFGYDPKSEVLETPILSI